MSQKKLPGRKPKGSPSPAEQVIVATLGGSEQPLTTHELREVMRAKLEAVLGPLERAVMAGQIDVLDYAHFLAKYGMGERGTPPVRAKNAVVMLPPRNTFATPSQQMAEVAEVVRVG